MKSIEFIFISESSIIGGIETLMVRMANSVHRDGHNVSVFCPEGPVVSEFTPGIKWTKVSDGMALGITLESFKPEKGTEHVSIWTSHPFMIADAYRLQGIIWKKWRVTSNSISGIFIPAQFVVSNDLIGLIKNNIIMKLPPLGSIYFMSDAVRLSFVEKFGHSFEKWPVKKLTHNVETNNISWTPKNTNRLSIVSVGRLTPFKAYNFGAANIVKEIRDAGVDCEWHIWGEGKDLDLARAYAKTTGVGDFLQFHGTLPYREFASEVCKHSLFIGMGTAALEAASCGMPTVIALVNSKRECAGYLHEAPSDSIGEDVSHKYRKNVIDLLFNFTNLSPEQQQNIGSKCRTAISNRMNEKEGGVSADLQDGLNYPSSLLTALKMNTYTFTLQIWRRLTRIQRRNRNVKLTSRP